MKYNILHIPTGKLWLLNPVTPFSKSDLEDILPKIKQIAWNRDNKYTNFIISKNDEDKMREYIKVSPTEFEIIKMEE